MNLTPATQQQLEAAFSPEDLADLRGRFVSAPDRVTQEGVLREVASRCLSFEVRKAVIEPVIQHFISSNA